jgi:spore germination protein GerM
MAKITIFILILLLAVFVGVVAYLAFPTSPMSPEAEKQLEANVYFSNSQKNPETLDCGKVYPVKRKLEEDFFPPYSILTKLLEGPSEEEKQEGYFTNINQGVKINSLDVKERKAFVDFDSRLQENVGGSCLVLAIRTQVEETLKQFDNIEEVVISVEGEVEKALQP